MEKAKVYYTDFRTVAFGDGLPTKLKKLIKKAGIGQMDMDGKFVAIKMHFGELGNLAFLRPNYAKVRAQGRNGEWFEAEGEELIARCFCHELEHLDGMIFLDKAIEELSVV
mgnify:CR=1 FL=1